MSRSGQVRSARRRGRYGPVEVEWHWGDVARHGQPMVLFVTGGGRCAVGLVAHCRAPLLRAVCGVGDFGGPANKKPPGHMGSGCGRTRCGARRQVRRSSEVEVEYITQSMVPGCRGLVKDCRLWGGRAANGWLYGRRLDRCSPRESTRPPGLKASRQPTIGPPIRWICSITARATAPQAGARTEANNPHRAPNDRPTATPTVT